MNKFVKSLTLFLSGVPLLSGKTSAANFEEVESTPPTLDPVRLHPLNLPEDNLFARHSSHSSHGSHASHRSSSGGGGAYRTPTPQSQPTDPGRAKPVTPVPAAPAAPQLSREEKLGLQVMRVQIALTSLGLYAGTVDGQLNDDTKEALKRFQTLKGLPADGLMSTETLNALGVPAVQ